MPNCSFVLARLFYEAHVWQVKAGQQWMMEDEGGTGIFSVILFVVFCSSRSNKHKEEEHSLLIRTLCQRQNVFNKHLQLETCLTKHR